MLVQVRWCCFLYSSLTSFTHSMSHSHDDRTAFHVELLRLLVNHALRNSHIVVVDGGLVATHRLICGNHPHCFDVHIVYHGSIMQDAIMIDYVHIEAVHVVVTDWFVQCFVILLVPNGYLSLPRLPPLLTAVKCPAWFFAVSKLLLFT